MPSHTLPPFLDGIVEPETCEKWLRRKSAALVARDRKRDRPCTRAAYREAIHQAAMSSAGKDAHTGEDLDWTLITKYRNEESRLGRHGYKQGFALLPTVEHVTADEAVASFRTCG